MVTQQQHQLQGPPGVWQNEEPSITDIQDFVHIPRTFRPKVPGTHQLGLTPQPIPSPSPPQMSPQQLLLQAGDAETNPEPALRCGVCRKSTTAKAVICCTCQWSIHHSCSGMTRTMLKQCCQTNNYHCHNCRSVSNFQILCCQCGKGF